MVIIILIGYNSSETEIECVANRFDMKGFIDTKEFLTSLRPSAVGYS